MINRICKNLIPNAPSPDNCLKWLSPFITTVNKKFECIDVSMTDNNGGFCMATFFGTFNFKMTVQFQRDLYLKIKNK